jgi:hypothetical protein
MRASFYQDEDELPPLTASGEAHKALRKLEE